ncbi:MAG: hypothetical protein ACE3JK_01050 [Sporolactobacillus sp.]
MDKNELIADFKKRFEEQGNAQTRYVVFIGITESIVKCTTISDAEKIVDMNVLLKALDEAEGKGMK